MNRVFNFAAGPGILPLPVLEEAAANFVDYHGQGMSLIEMSHRGAIFAQIIRETKDLLRELLAIPDTHDVLLLQGGGHTQFAMVPLNLLGAAAEASYIVSGIWSKKAAAEAAKFCHVNVIGTPSKVSIPPQDAVVVANDAAYLYYCMNETVNGLEFNYIPKCPDCVPLVADVSSDFLSRPIDFKRHALVYAGAQKNIGPAGVVIAVIREDLITEDVLPGTPTMLRYKTHADNGSMYNTPPAYGIYICGKVFQWLLSMGGLEAIRERNVGKAKVLYDFLDASRLFHGTVVKKDRSLMNVPFVTGNAELDAKFVKAAEAAGFVSLKGHRTVGGMRASIYNAMPMEGVVKLVQFMERFEKENR